MHQTSRHVIQARATVLARFVAVAAALGSLLCAGCHSEASRLEAFYIQAIADRAAAAEAMAEAVRGERITLDAAIDLAHERLESRGDSTAFAGAVLECAVIVEHTLPKSGEFEIFWRRLGRVAFHAANRAREAGDGAGALSLVLAGPARWRNDAYWLRYPDHDALAAYILYESGRRGEALERLRSRPELIGPAEEAYNQIVRAP